MERRVVGVMTIAHVESHFVQARNNARLRDLPYRLQVFTSSSTITFKTFACDDEVVHGESYLRADYSLSCETNLHIFFQVYAALMILVSRPASRERGRGHPVALTVPCDPFAEGIRE